MAEGEVGKVAPRRRSVPAAGPGGGEASVAVERAVGGSPAAAQGGSSEAAVMAERGVDSASAVVPTETIGRGGSDISVLPEWDHGKKVISPRVRA